MSGRCARLALTRDGEVIASAGDDMTVRVWEVESGSARNLLKGHTDAVLGLAFSPTRGCWPPAGRDGEVKIWDPAGAGPRTAGDPAPSGRPAGRLAGWTPRGGDLPRSVGPVGRHF